MRSRSVRWGELFIFIGVLVLALQYIDWKAFAPIERADLVIAGGIVLLMCFVLALWSRSLLVDELIHLVALVVGALALGLILTASVGFPSPFSVSKAVSFEESVGDAQTLKITLDIQNGDITVQTWERETFRSLSRRALARGTLPNPNSSSRARFKRCTYPRRGSAFAPHDSHWGRSAHWRRTCSSGCRAGASMS
jgi:hypothetical protein